ncbi:hypothetical protein ACSBR1_015536 [Camellia fascicularis]
MPIQIQCISTFDKVTIVTILKDCLTCQSRGVAFVSHNEALTVVLLSSIATPLQHLLRHPPSQHYRSTSSFAFSLFPPPFAFSLPDLSLSFDCETLGNASRYGGISYVPIHTPSLLQKHFSFFNTAVISVFRMPLGGAVVTAGSTAVKESWNCFKPHFDYVKDLKKNCEELGDEYKCFTEVKKDMNKQIEIRMSKNARTTHECNNLLGRVRSTESKCQELLAKHKMVYKHLWGMWPFFELRKLGEQVVETKVKVVKQKNEMKDLMKDGNVMIEMTPEQVENKIVDLNSLSQNVQQVLKLLRHNKWIGIFGSRGVGKTTLLEKLRIEANKNGKFDTVILISCQREDGERKIREDLVRQLKLSVASMEDAADNF